MSVSDWRRLKDHREHVVLAEVAALLHDVGKFTNLHIEANSVGGQRRWSNDHAYKAIIDDPQTAIQLAPGAAKLKKPASLNGVLNAASPKAADFLTPNAKNFLQATQIEVLSEKYSLAELIMLGTPGFAASPARGQLLDGMEGWLAAVLGVCHYEAHHDKQEPAKGEGAQTYPDVFTSTAFGYEVNKVFIGSSSESLDHRLVSLAFPPSRDEIVHQFAFGLGDTRRPINEITLADWSSTVASLLKPAVAEALITGKQRGIRQWASRKDIDHDLRWRLLRINFDVLGLYSRAIKLADLFGYVSAVDEACRQTKHFLEDEYPLGNEIFRDTTGIYFTFPDFDLPADLGLELRRIVEESEPVLAPRIRVGAGQGNIASEQLKQVLADQHSAALEELSFAVGPDNLSPCWNALWENLPDGAWEVCPVCRLRPKQEEAEVCCHCAERRKPRLKVWKENPDRTTIWLDELADENGRIALVVGKFGLDDWLSGDLVQTLLVRCDPANNSLTLKNPSPARLRRVWETCQKFWENVVSTIFSKHIPDRARWELLPRNDGDVDELPKDEVCDGMLNGKPASVFRIGDHLLTVSYFPEDALPQPGTLCVSWESRNKRDLLPLAIAEVRKPAGDIERFRTYSPTLTLLTSPDQFMAFTPASAAVDLAEKIKNSYAREFGKVQDRLPLFLGLVFFHRKAPLFAAIDTARRMLLQVELADELWKVECHCPSPDGHHHRLRLSRSSNHMDYDVPVKMGDMQTEDVSYPYLFVESQTDNRSRRFQVQEGTYAGRSLVHASELRPEDKLLVWPSRFGYKFLEHSAQRFEFDPRRDIVYLDELPRLTKMWSEIRKTTNMTDTRLRGVASLLEAKKDNWGNNSEEFRLLAETTLKQAKLLGDNTAVTPEDVICGRFGRCLELHLRILKQRVKGESDAEPVSV